MLLIYYRAPLSIAAVFVLTTAFTFSSRAQSARFDQPTPMASNTAEGTFPKGAFTSHYFSFTAGPGEVFITFSFSPGRPDSEFSTTTAFVGGQLSDHYGRAFTNLDAGLGKADPTSVDTAVFPGRDETLVGRFSIPRRQKLVVKIFTSLLEVEAPVKYRVRVEGGDPSFASESGQGDKPVNGTVKDSHPRGELNNASATGSTGTTSVTRRSTGPARTSTRPSSCLAEYQACLKRSIISKAPGATSQCIVQRAYCERRQRSSSAASGSQTWPQGVGETAGQNGKAQQGTTQKSKRKH